MLALAPAGVTWVPTTTLPRHTSRSRLNLCARPISQARTCLLRFGTVGGSRNCMPANSPNREDAFKRAEAAGSFGSRPLVVLMSSQFIDRYANGAQASDSSQPVSMNSRSMVAEGESSDHLRALAYSAGTAA